MHQEVAGEPRARRDPYRDEFPHDTGQAVNVFPCWAWCWYCETLNELDPVLLRVGPIAPNRERETVPTYTPKVPHKRER